jgi:hypothetical protein
MSGRYDSMALLSGVNHRGRGFGCLLREVVSTMPLTGFQKEADLEHPLAGRSSGLDEGFQRWVRDSVGQLFKREDVWEPPLLG